jgi:hypothetical protein
LTNIGDYPDEQYFDDFPLDFGSNSRGSFIINKSGEAIGLVEAHRKSNGDVCAGHLYWIEPEFGWFASHHLWVFTSTGPAEHQFTLTPSILCDCGHHGFITNGKFEPTGDSTV